ncbi:hypothetical protein GCM10010988_07240 [Cnuibacter physcomitrellae]|uniref:Uncharacterized protein n=1 Tax=Cnuibacter physcomitrellae TaxID=1619308 RepID=A0A1X9LKG9_9MICO|nr:DUF4177 domain-containing protein [Cnuibacter physcomitrellae]ARJ05617.1 hypothetical protein B5808_10565 [Cnuibacter physcomitrellae]MCS5496684.1 DUF4177 domain-containing protein [Cnuibacter physcomitrellae]GGI36096.1 hypothetical protein GCM10010988_07240 [Cnuibacter physcomitrellae]
MAGTPAGYYDDGTGTVRWYDGQKWTEQVQAPPPARPGLGGFVDRAQAEAVSQAQPRPAQNGYSYVVLQVVLKEKFFGTGSGNLTDLENVINKQTAQGYRLHTITTASSGSKGMGGGDRIQATMVFEKLS